MSSQKTFNILIVEDEKEVLELLAIQMLREGYEVTKEADGVRAVESLKQKTYDLVLLDWMLPGKTGFEILNWMQTQNIKKPKVILVTARVEATDIIKGLEAGADDYITKPFDISVLKARVKAVLRRNQESSAAETIQIQDLQINLNSHQVLFAGRPLDLTLSEYNLLVCLAQNRGRVLTREILIQAIRGDGVNVTHRTIDTHTFALRKKLGEAGSWIEAIRGVGYRLI